MIALAREAARKSIVLLKNDGDLLPLPKSGKSIAFIGPYVSDKADILGSWAVFSEPQKAVSLEEGVRAALGPDGQCSFTMGCASDRAINGGVDQAVAAARNADIVVLYLGERERMTGEAASMTSITIPPHQMELAEAVAATGKPRRRHSQTWQGAGADGRGARRKGDPVLLVPGVGIRQRPRRCAVRRFRAARRACR